MGTSNLIFSNKRFLLYSSLSLLLFLATFFVLRIRGFDLLYLSVPLLIYLTAAVFIYPQVGILLVALFVPFEKLIVDQYHLLPQIGTYFDEYLIMVMLLSTFFYLVFSQRIKEINREGIRKVSFLIILYVLATLLSAVVNKINHVVYIFSVRAILQYAVLFYVIILHPLINKNLIRKLLIITIFIGLAQIPLSIYFILNRVVMPYIIGFIDETRFTFGVYNTAYGSFGNPNSLAPFVVFVIFLIFAFYQGNKNKLYLVGIFLLTLLVFLTFSRSTIIALVLVLVLLFFLSKKRELLAGFLILIYLIAAVVALSPANTDYSLSKFRFDLSSGRMTMWKQSFYLFEENPIFGIGPGMFGGGTAYFFKSPLTREQKIGSEYGAISPHTVDSNVISMLIEIGVIGFLFFIFIIFEMVRVSWDRYKYLDINLRDRYFYLAFIFFALVFIFDGIFATTWENHQVAFYFWLLASYLYISKPEKDQQIT